MKQFIDLSKPNSTPSIPRKVVQSQTAVPVTVIPIQKTNVAPFQQVEKTRQQIQTVEYPPTPKAVSYIPSSKSGNKKVKCDTTGCKTVQEAYEKNKHSINLLFSS